MSVTLLVVIIESFQSVNQSFSWQLEEASDGSQDILPPAKVEDLRAVTGEKFLDGGTSYNVSLTWTATGDDMDIGKG